jgi:hypothetical protein
MRAGAYVLTMAADPANREILRSMLDNPFNPLEPDLRSRYEITPDGREALFVAFIAERWIQSSPRGPVPFDSREGELAIAALAEGWNSTAIHALAREPLSFDELHRTTEGIGRGALKLRLEAMLAAGQVESLADGEGGEIFALTDWLRSGIAPLIAAARLERRRPTAGTSPIDPLDVDAGFRLSLPLIEMPKELTGTCRLALNTKDDETPGLTGVTAQIEEGRVISCEPGITQKADAWAAASAGDWLDTVIEPQTKRVRTGGDRWLAAAVLTALHKTLFGIRVA